MGRLVGLAMTTAIRGYQLLLAPVLPPSCRYWPSCSHYAAEAVARHGPWCGGRLALQRLARCHPWGGSGYDPVPVRQSKPAEYPQVPARVHETSR